MNWKGHTILGIIFGLPFISSPEQIFLVLAGALYPDLDHDVKEDIVKRGLLISGGIVFINILLYFFDKKLFNIELFILGVSVFLIYLIPYFSEHRGLTHTFWSLIFVSSILGYLSYKLSFISSVFAGLISLLMVTNEALLGRIMMYAIFAWAVLDILNLKLGVSGLYHYILPVAFGYLSHIFGDTMTPAGVRAFYPVSNYKMKKKEGYLILILWILAVLYFWRGMILSII
ncbi:membrane-bound metal-dependent hydrolase [Methanocaldococcus vulcanius M7]|uniref:Membrane-bound metal-dependent hydrolase n=1 Tax=Methanocaldococcus vulcanius (strain ATCC 700851 / DSM 12094 / M7) TaxID=579137 RepID=C9RE90_METVM|nr:metal-dependent hydrolase [Methanocaldococcus vulcanius]ACX71892.1 membrane-bound metal-dependent hydrolase [Methanocaldococcus vulcanius M7]